MMEFTVWDIARNLLLAARWTILLSVIAFVGGGILGFLLLTLRVSKYASLRRVVILYIELFQGTPLLLQLFLGFFAPALLGIESSPWTAATIVLVLYTSAYLVDIWRGCVDAIPKGQWSAGASLGLSYTDQLVYVIWPQAQRIAIAPTVGFLVQVIKSTALASVIGLVELTRTGNMISNVAFDPFLIYGLVAVIYFFICFPLTLYARHLEKKALKWGQR